METDEQRAREEHDAEAPKDAGRERRDDENFPDASLEGPDGPDEDGRVPFEP